MHSISQSIQPITRSKRKWEALEIQKLTALQNLQEEFKKFEKFKENRVSALCKAKAKRWKKDKKRNIQLPGFFNYRSNVFFFHCSNSDQILFATIATWRMFYSTNHRSMTYPKKGREYN